jgi:type II secretory pathway pseudopilin PulG
MVRCNGAKPMTARNATKRGPEAGFTLIDMMFVVAVMGLLMTLAIPGLMRARGAAQVSSAVGTMRTINSAQLSYAITCGLGFYSPDFPTLGVKPPSAAEAFLSPELTGAATFIKSGYTFSMAGTPLGGAPATCNGLGAGGAAPGYAVVADSLDPVGNNRFLGSNADGVLYEHSASLAATMPESGPPPAGSPIK